MRPSSCPYVSAPSSSAIATLSGLAVALTTYAAASSLPSATAQGRSKAAGRAGPVAAAPRGPASPPLPASSEAAAAWPERYPEAAVDVNRFGTVTGRCRIAHNGRRAPGANGSYRAPRASLAAVAVTVALLGGCGGSDEETVSEGGTARPTRGRSCPKPSNRSLRTMIRNLPQGPGARAERQHRRARQEPLRFRRCSTAATGRSASSRSASTSPGGSTRPRTALTSRAIEPIDVEAGTAARRRPRTPMRRTRSTSPRALRAAGAYVVSAVAKLGAGPGRDLADAGDGESPQRRARRWETRRFAFTRRPASRSEETSRRSTRASRRTPCTTSTWPTRSTRIGPC